MQKSPYLGFGLGLRPDHYQDILAQNPALDWFEIMSEDYMVAGGNPLYFLDKVRERYPIVMHGVSLSIASLDPLDKDYLKALKQLADRVDAKWVSDHLCWTGNHGINLHDLLPVPYTEEALQHVIDRVKQVQDFLGRPFLLENPSSYVAFKESTMPEWEFMARVANEADCLILLDINNIYVSSFNHNFNPIDYLNGMPATRIQQFHLAGHLNLGTHIIDTHDHDIIDPVWELYATALKKFGTVSTMIERDANIPPLADLLTELEQARQIFHKVFKSTSAIEQVI